MGAPTASLNLAKHQQALARRLVDLPGIVAELARDVGGRMRLLLGCLLVGLIGMLSRCGARFAIFGMPA